MTAKPGRFMAALILVALPAAGTELQLEISDATVEDVSRSGLAQVVEQARAAVGEPVWLVYEVDAVPQRGSICCGHGDCCDVERSGSGVHVGSASNEGPVAVLVRFSGGEPSRIRVVGRDCAVGFGGRHVLWAGGIETGTSVELLDRLASSSSRRVTEGAVMAIAYHDDPAATRWLEALALADEDEDLSEEAIFWIGIARAEDGLASLRRILTSDIDLERREAVIFSLSQSSAAEAQDDLARMARSDASPKIRSEALFWLGQADKGSNSELIYEAALTDPDPEVAKQAVFVLSQLAQPEALEQLARLLVQEDRPEIRKEALFWIAQTDSDKALEIVARILNE